MSATKLIPSAPLETITNVEEKFKMKMNDIQSFNNSINNTKEIITDREAKNEKNQKRIIKILSTLIKSFNTCVILATTSTSISISFTGILSIVKPISTEVACGLTIIKKLVYEIVIQKYDEHENFHQGLPEDKTE